MESDDNTELSDDSSFEILTSSDEDDSTNLLYNSSFKEKSFEILGNFFTSDPPDEEIETSVSQQDRQSYKNALCLKKDPFKSFLEDQPEICRHSEICIDKFIFSNEVSTSHPDASAESVQHSLIQRTSISTPADGRKARNLSLCKFLRDSQEESEWDRMLQAIRKGDCRDGSMSAFQRTIVIGPVVRSEREIPMMTDVQASENDNESLFVKPSENALSQLYPRRMNFYKEICPGLKYGLKLYSWFRSNIYLKKILNGAKNSFDSFLKVFELEQNQNVGEKSPLKITVIADVVDYIAIVDSFRNTFKGQVLICRSSSKSNTAQPVLPVSYRSALLSAEMKINRARQQRNYETNSVLLSTVTFLAENVPQKWQMSTVLCLDDPILGLSFHNFTQTIPVPNEYIHIAQMFTPEDYPYKDLGYAVTLKEAIDYTMNYNTGEDIQEFLTGVSHYATLKSAADVLSGMYSKYTCRMV